MRSLPHQRRLLVAEIDADSESHAFVPQFRPPSLIASRTIHIHIHGTYAQIDRHKRSGRVTVESGIMSDVNVYTSAGECQLGAKCLIVLINITDHQIIWKFLACDWLNARACGRVTVALPAS